MRGNKIWNLQFLKLIKVVGCSLAGIVACGGILWIVLSDESSEERVEDRPLVSIPNREPEPQVLPQPEPPKPDYVKERIQILEKTVGTVDPGEKDSSGGCYVVLKDEKLFHQIKVEKTFPVNYEYSHTWAGSTKTINAEKEYKAIARISSDQLPNLNVYIRANGDTTIHFDGLTLEGTGDIDGFSESRVIKWEEEDGVWNKINDEDRTIVQNELLKKAKVEAETCGAKTQAEQDYFILLRDTIEANVPLPSEGITD